MEEKKCVKFEFFTLSLKVTNLCKIVVDQNNFCLKILLTVWHQNSAFFFICLVKFTVKPHSSTIIMQKRCKVTWEISTWGTCTQSLQRVMEMELFMNLTSQFSGRMQFLNGWSKWDLPCVLSKIRLFSSQLQTISKLSGARSLMNLLSLPALLPNFWLSSRWTN